MPRRGAQSRFVLPLPRFLFHPILALFVSGIHLYLSVEHLSKLAGGEMTWTNLWKGFGALAGAYVFAALASRAAVGRSRAEPLLGRP